MKTPPPAEKRYELKTFVCKYECDVYRFNQLVLSKGAYWEGYMHVNFLNIWNNPVGFGQYLCVYQYYEDIDMEVCT